MQEKYRPVGIFIPCFAIIVNCDGHHRYEKQEFKFEHLAGVFQLIAYDV
jgi:hypothetical protein